MKILSIRSLILALGVFVLAPALAQSDQGSGDGPHPPGGGGSSGGYGGGEPPFVPPGTPIEDVRDATATDSVRDHLATPQFLEMRPVDPVPAGELPPDSPGDKLLKSMAPVAATDAPGYYLCGVGAGGTSAGGGGGAGSSDAGTGAVGELLGPSGQGSRSTLSDTDARNAGTPKQ
jgi:hypothetical protein